MEIVEMILNTDSLDETKKFYADILEFKILKESGGTISFQTGTSKLTFKLTDNDQNSKYHFAFAIPVNKIEEAMIWISKKAELIPIEGNKFIADFTTWNARAIYFYDNRRNILELICRADLDNPLEKEFSADSILCLNEIGIVTDEPLKLAAKIIDTTKTEYFRKGPKREDFVAVGNENGLFVISNPNRNWYPTNDKAEKHYVGARIKVAGNEFDFEFNA